MRLIRDYYRNGVYYVVNQLPNDNYQLTVQRSENDVDYWTMRSMPEIEKIEELYLLRDRYRTENEHPTNSWLWMKQCIKENTYD
jgi:hypothetical protein